MVKTLLAAAIAGLVVAGSAQAYDFTPVARGFENPVYVTSAPGDPATLYVVERGGVIRIVLDGAEDRRVQPAQPVALLVRQRQPLDRRRRRRQRRGGGLPPASAPQRAHELRLEPLRRDAHLQPRRQDPRHRRADLAGLPLSA